MMLFFYCLFNGLLSYIIPVQILELGLSKSQMGLLIGSSNIFGALFDFVLAKFIRNTSYRRLYLVVFGLCFVYPLILWSSKTVPIFMISMAIWGLYSDLSAYATYDLISRRSKENEHCKSFGILGIFRNLGYLIAPILAGLVVAETIDFFPYSLSLSFIIMGFIFYLLLIEFSPKKDSPEYDHQAVHRRHDFFTELHAIKKIGAILFTVLIFSVALYVFDATYWTIGPIFAESFPDFKDFGGIFMTAYTLPVLIVNWFVGPVTAKFGKKRTAYYSFLIGCLFLLPLGFIHDPWLVIALTFMSSLVSSIAWPAIDGAFADYMSETKDYEKEIISLTDFACNIGYIIGPIIAGILADVVGNQNVFLALGLANIVLIITLILVTPKHIKVKI